MRADQLERLSDGIHNNLGIDNEGHIEPSVGFDYDEIDRNVFDVEDEEETVSFSDMAAALALIVGFACASPDLKLVGARIAAIGVLLDPINMPHNRRTLADIAREAGLSRACVSKWMIDFRDQIGTSLTVGKRSSARAADRAGQVAAIERGTHVSFVRAKKAA
jgi:leucine-zipper of insertion element IS481